MKSFSEKMLDLCHAIELLPAGEMQTKTAIIARDLYRELPAPPLSIGHPESFYEAQRDSMTFGMALEALREGLKVSRDGWNGNGQWVVMMPSLSLPPFSSQEPGAKVNDRTAKHIGNDTALDSQPYFSLFNAQQKWQPGWVPSVSDCLANDWMIV